MNVGKFSNGTVIFRSTIIFSVSSDRTLRCEHRLLKRSVYRPSHLFISIVLTTWFIERNIRNLHIVIRLTFRNTSKYWLWRTCFLTCFCMPLALFCDFVRQSRLYIFAHKPTNSLGAIDPVSLLNLPRTRWFAVEYSGWSAAKLLVSIIEQLRILSHFPIQIMRLDFAAQWVGVGKQKTTSILYLVLRYP